jgi:hypothetical protein
MERRRETLINRGDATLRADGRLTCRRNMIVTPQEREGTRAGAEFAAAKPISFRPLPMARQ